jgi:uncharacterized protein YndB with AHSA1/START domain
MAIAYTETRGIVLRLERRFAAPRERVFEAWTTPEALKQWWCPQDGNQIGLKWISASAVPSTSACDE